MINNKNVILILICLIFFISGCGKNLIMPPGSVSVYACYLQQKTSVSLISKKSNINNEKTMISTIYIRNVEISKDRKEWVKILSGPVEFQLTRIKSVSDSVEFLHTLPDKPVRISEPITLPEGKYHYLRITLEPMVRFFIIFSNETSSEKAYIDVTLNKVPKEIELSGTNPPIYLFSSDENANINENIMFTSENGGFVPFDIERNTETFLVFSFKIIEEITLLDEITDWKVQMGINITKSIF